MLPNGYSQINRYGQAIPKRIGLPTVERQTCLSRENCLQLLYKVGRSRYPIRFPNQHFAGVSNGNHSDILSVLMFFMASRMSCLTAVLKAPFTSGRLT